MAQGEADKRKRPDAGDVADAVRTAVDRTFQATVGQAQVTRERAQELVERATRPKKAAPRSKTAEKKAR